MEKSRLLSPLIEVFTWSGRSLTDAPEKMLNLGTLWPSQVDT